MLKYILILPLFLLYAYKPVTPLSQQDKKYVGTWECKSAHETDCLVIKANGHYYLEARCFCPTYKSYGTWHVKNDSLILMQTKCETDDPDPDLVKEFKRNGKFKTLVFKQYCFNKKPNQCEDYLCEIEDGEASSGGYFKPGFKERLKAHDTIR